MRKSRAKVFVGFGVAGLVVEWYFDPTVFLGGPLIGFAGFLILLGLAPSTVHSLVYRLPPDVAGRIWGYCEWISELIEGDDNLSAARKNYVKEQLKDLGEDDLAYLRQMLVSGHAHNPPGDVWARLKAIGVVWSDFSGPRGINPEITQVVSDFLDDYERIEIKNNLGEHLNKLTELRNINRADYDNSVLLVQGSVEECREYIESKLGSGEATRFMDSHGYTFYGGDSIEVFLQGRIRRLNELIGRVDTLTILS